MKRFQFDDTRVVQSGGSELESQSNETQADHHRFPIPKTNVQSLTKTLTWMPSCLPTDLIMSGDRIRNLVDMTTGWNGRGMLMIAKRQHKPSTNRIAWNTVTNNNKLHAHHEYEKRELNIVVEA
jgi:hypothetical protein